MAKKPAKWSWSLAGLAFCHRCQNAYRDGKKDCGVVSCELYPRMPYRKLTPAMPYLEWNPRQQGYKDWNGEPLNVDAPTDSPVTEEMTVSPHADTTVGEIASQEIANNNAAGDMFGW